MELDQLFGLPAHPLLVHLPVVLIPVAGLMALAMAIRPAWFQRYGWWLVGVSGVGMVGAILAAGSGETLQEKVRRSAALQDHAQLGETARTVSVLFFVVALGVMLFRWWYARRTTGSAESDAGPKRAVVIGTSVLLVVVAAWSTTTIVQAGHQGAKVTWSAVGSQSGG